MKALFLALTLIACGTLPAQSRYAGPRNINSAAGANSAGPAAQTGTLSQRPGRNGVPAFATRKSSAVTDTVKMTDYLLRRSPLMPDASKPADTIPQPYPDKSTIDNMPNAFISAGPPVYKGNNGNGFDLYQSPVDNMPLLMPDSSNRSSLKISQKPYQQIKPLKREMRKPLQFRIKPL